MRNDITHLPKQIRMDLEYITTFLLGQTHEIHLRPQNGARIRYIVLHGCFTEDHWQPDTELRPAEVSYRYNLLVIISKNLPEIHTRLQEAVNQLNQSDKVGFPVSIQVDTHGRTNRKLEDGYLAYDRIQTRVFASIAGAMPETSCFSSQNSSQLKSIIFRPVIILTMPFRCLSRFCPGRGSFRTGGSAMPPPSCSILPPYRPM